MTLTKRLNEAMQIAATAHESQKRKGTHIPYISHPFAVMTIARTVTDDENTLIACLFHDILEDVPEAYSKETMRRDFGSAVVAIVEGVTKDSSLDSWQARSEAYLHHLSNEASRESVIVSAADKYHNLLSIVSDYEQIGDDIWTRFNSGKGRQLWWYSSIEAVLNERIPDIEITEQYAVLLQNFKLTVGENTGSR